MSRIPQDKSIWRTKAINNKNMAEDLAENFGGNVRDYLRTANQVLRKKIINSKM